ncbi:hypothetical protein ES708_19109 [subsurface metagenome]
MKTVEKEDLYKELKTTKKKKITSDEVLAIRDLDYITRKRKVEELKKELFGI